METTPNTNKMRRHKIVCYSALKMREILIQHGWAAIPILIHSLCWGLTQGLAHVPCHWAMSSVSRTLLKWTGYKKTNTTWVSSSELPRLEVSSGGWGLRKVTMYEHTEFQGCGKCYLWGRTGKIRLRNNLSVCYEEFWGWGFNLVGRMFVKHSHKALGLNPTPAQSGYGSLLEY